MKRPPKNGVRIPETKTLLVDGNALFKVGFFGAKDEYNFRGEHIGGLYQFLTVVRKLLNEDLYHRVYVFWDGHLSGKMRWEFYKDYKSDRGKDFINGSHPVEESEVNQKGLIRDYLKDLCIRQIMHDFVESDDFIAYYCLSADENEKITICTNDRDLSQLISEKVKIYFCDLKAYVDITNYSSYFCHHQSNVALIKTIIGDSSDTIVGVKGVKEKTLLENFPELKTRKLTLDEILTKASELQENRIKAKQKPLLALDHIIRGVRKGDTKGEADKVLGEELYKLNHRLVDLRYPLMTADAIDELEDLRNGYFDMKDRGIKNVLYKMRLDGLDKTIGSERYAEYLLPFKRLMEREIRESEKNTTL